MNDFFQNAQNGFSLMAPLIAQRNRQQDMAESARRWDADFKQRQVEFDAQHSLNQQRNQRLGSYYDSIEAESAVRRDVERFKMEKLKTGIEEGDAHRKRLAEVEKQLADASRQPGGTHYAKVVADAMYANPDLLVSSNPEVRARMQELNKTVQARMAVGMATERMKDEMEAAQRGMPLTDYLRQKVEVEAAAKGYSDAAKAKELPTLPNGELDPVKEAEFRRKVEVEADARKAAQLNDKGSYLDRVLEYDEEGRPKVRARMSLDDAQRQGFDPRSMFSQPKAPAPDLSVTQEQRLAGLRRALIDLKAAQLAKVEKVDPDNLEGTSPNVDRSPWWGGVSPDEAIKRVEAETAVLEGRDAAQAQGGVSTQPSGAARVRVVSPQGVVGTVPASSLEQALAQGYRVVAPAEGQPSTKPSTPAVGTVEDGYRFNGPVPGQR